MVVTTVLVRVRGKNIDDFIAATKKNHDASVKEPGNVRFDILQSVEDPEQFLMYEAYTNAPAAAAHKETAHYRAWRDEVADYMAVPRRGIKYVSVAPAG